jgi:hypothetical protein
MSKSRSIEEWKLHRLFRASQFQRKKVTASFSWRNDFDSASILGLFYVRLIILISLEISQPSLSYSVYVHTVHERLIKPASESMTYLFGL